MNILCMCPIGIGNYLLCYPAFVLLKKLLPSASLHLLALREGIAHLAAGDPLWAGITVMDPTKIKTTPLRPLLVLADLRRKKCEASLNFFPSNGWHYHVLPWLAGIGRRYGFRYQISPPAKLSVLCNHTTPVDVSLHDIYQNYRLVGFFLGKDVDRPEPVFPVICTEADRQWARRELDRRSANTLRIGVHPGSSAEHGMLAKRWPPEKFAGLTDRVCRLLCAEAYIFGGADEETVKQTVADAMRCRSHVMPVASLPKTAALLSQCSLCICNDSGLMHIAACLGVPTAGIFGPTDENRNGPFGSTVISIRKKMRGFPVWTAANVGDRSTPKGIDPREGLDALDLDEAWGQLRPWIEATLKTPVASKPE